MGTRADFYLKRGKDAVWVASIALDGYPEAIDFSLLKSTSEKDFLDNLSKFLENRDDVFYPKDEWPWPWDDSSGTDYTYSFDQNQVYVSEFGSAWVSGKDVAAFEKRIMDLKKKIKHYPNQKKEIQLEIESMAEKGIFLNREEMEFPNMSKKKKYKENFKKRKS